MKPTPSPGEQRPTATGQQDSTADVQRLSRPGQVSQLVSRVNLGVLYTAAAGGPPPSWTQGVNAAIYRSKNEGERWERLGAGLPERFDSIVSSLLEDDEGNVYAAAGGQIYESKDRGDNWPIQPGPGSGPV